MKSSITPPILARVADSAFSRLDMLKAFADAAEKQTFGGGVPHHIWCNSPVPNGNGYGRCNCGVADVLSCLRAYQSVNWEERG